MRAEGAKKTPLAVLSRGICVIAPAVMNAIFAATGKPVRSTPTKNLKLV